MRTNEAAIATSPQQQQQRYEVETVNIIMGRTQFVDGFPHNVITSTDCR